MEKNNDQRWDGKSRGGRSGYLFFIQIIRLFGVRFAYFWLALVAVYFIPFAPGATAAAWDYSRKRLHHNFFYSILFLYRHYYTFGQTLIDKIALRSGKLKGFRFEFENYSQFQKIMEKNTGTVIIGAHVGCWEAGAAFFGQYENKMNMVMFESEHEDIRQLLTENRNQEKFSIISTSKDPLDAILKIKIALNNKECVCFNGDRYTSRESAVPKRFINTDALFPTGPFRIASKCDVPVVFYYAFREKKRKYHFIFDIADPDHAKDWNKLMDQYVLSLEDAVRKHPLQWFNFYKFWNNQILRS